MIMKAAFLLLCLVSLSPALAGATAVSSRNEEKTAVTRHSLILEGRTVEYTATAGFLQIGEKAGSPKANIFFIAYEREGHGSKRNRPVTFVFNGGPGASSLWLHLGAAGPRRIARSYEGTLLPPPYYLIDNEYTWLGMTDLVFIDPVGTGYSRAAAGENPEQFYGVREDTRSVGEFIRLYVSKYGRWLSPKIIAGESYGTTRAVALAHHLHDAHGMDINALVLISSVLNFQAIMTNPGNDLPYAIFLPSYTAAASHHGKTSFDSGVSLPGVLQEVEKWALREYLPALAQGDALPAEERRRVREKLAFYTGLSETLIENNNLRISAPQFLSNLLQEENCSPGLLDSRYTNVGRTDALFYHDPSFYGTLGAFAATMNDYVRSELQYESDLSPYEYLSKRVNALWNWGSALQGYITVTDTLQDLLWKNPHLKVFIASGYYDLNTPYFSAVYNINHLWLGPKLRENVTLAFYEAGHQMYTDRKSLIKLKTDMETFFVKACPPLSGEAPGHSSEGR
ncbi:MAG: peptidase S10 [Alphaproteobacteria bacterium]|uniref:Peptidase S10 n=1 Tax=Candidatus Nitrobium versatile TaxID=2884831 RepID=A0A953M213_9BACT|nr:peptidase S10 [Candidatus Nitrobium versatile]